jgi:hypothetical protein
VAAIFPAASTCLQPILHDFRELTSSSIPRPPGPESIKACLVLPSTIDDEDTEASLLSDVLAMQLSSHDRFDETFAYLMVRDIGHVTSVRCSDF